MTKEKYIKINFTFFVISFKNMTTINLKLLCDLHYISMDYVGLGNFSTASLEFF